MESIEARRSSRLESVGDFIRNHIKEAQQDAENDYSLTYTSSSNAPSTALDTASSAGASYSNQYMDYIHTPSTSHSTMIGKAEDSIQTGINQYSKVEAAGLLSWNLLNEIQLTV